MNTNQKTKAVLITEIISPYRIPVFNEIAKSDQVEFKVFFLAETVRGRPWRVEKEKISFRYQVVPGIGIWLPDRFPIFFNPPIRWLLEKENPDLVIGCGYHHPTCLLALRYARSHGKRFILWSESHRDSIRLRSFPFKQYRSNFIHSSDGFVVPGRKSFNFIQSFGIDGKKMWTAPNAVANDFFSRNADTFRSQRQTLKSKRNFPSKIILYVGRLVDSKGIPVLLEAFQSVSKSLEAGLILVGEGKDQKKYLNFCRRHGLRNVFFEGFKQQDELPFYYGLADVFVLPSLREEWGLVLNEAAASGLPLIATDASGAAFDLIEEAKNGYRVRTGDSEALREKILAILKNPELQDSMGRRSREMIEAFSPQRCAAVFLQAILNKDAGC